MPSWRFRIVIASSVGSMVVACAIYDQSLLLPAPATQEAGVDSGSPIVTAEGGTQVDAGCIHAAVPAAPAKDDPSTGPDVDFVVAASYFRVVTGSAATHPPAPTGLDLDGVCTCPGAPTCISTNPKGSCDLDGGADDNGGVFFANYATLDPAGFSDMGLSQGVSLGANGLLYRVKNYNGKPNDTQVTVIAYESSGIHDPDGGAVLAPVLDGTDAWSVAPNSLLGGDSVDGGASCEGNDSVCVPTFFDTKAYVVNGTLVAHLDHPFFIGYAVSRIQVLLDSSVIVAPLVASGQSFIVDNGRISGRWSTTKFLTALQSVGDPLMGTGPAGLCGDSGTYQNIKTGVCAAADIMDDPSKDGTSAACDAFSMQVSFTAVPAHLGPIAPQGKLRTPCGATYQDQCP